MNLINEDLKLKILKGTPILLKKTNGFFIHRTIGEIIDYTYSEFLKVLQLFLISDKEIQENMPIPGMNVFLYFLITLNNKSELSSMIESGFNFFIGAENIIPDMENKKIIYSYKDINNIEINEDGFNEIVDYIKIIYNGTFINEEQDLSEGERRMKEKFDRRRREREAAKKYDNSDKVNFSDMLGGFTVRNHNFNWKNVINLPYYTFFFLLKKLRKYDDYEVQLRVRLAGADVKEELHHWLSGDDDED